MTPAPWRFWIDRGGTFTDIVACDPQGRLSASKRLSEEAGGPACRPDAALAGIAAALGLPAGAPIPPGLVGSVRMGTTVATNALLERRGARVLLLTNRGLGDLLRIGDQSRPDLFARAIVRPAPLHERVGEITGRLAADGREVTPLDEDAARALLAQARDDGIEACAIALLHAWAHPAHERRLGELARAAGFAQVSVSHQVSPHLRLVPRAQTTVLDAALSPVLARHVGHLAAALPGTRLLFMQSHGGLAGAERFSGRDAILSGPAGGIVGAARTAERAGLARIISFDMGGTSTDVALYDGKLQGGGFERRLESRVAGLALRVPMLAIHTVAADGGSVLRFDGARMRVGPQSAGAAPGPRAYRNGGPLTVTDANLLLGNLRAERFPALFGPNRDAPLDLNAVAAGFADLADAVAAETGTRHAPHALAEAFVRIAVANMANAIREISVRRGEDPAGFALHCFGGAGGQHACQLAAALGMRTILVHPLAGVLSAYGLALAEQSVLRERSVDLAFEPGSLARLMRICDSLAADAVDALAAETDPGTETATERRLHLRHAGSEAVLIVPFGDADSVRDDFARQHHARFGFDEPDRAIIVDAIAVEVRTVTPPPPAPSLVARQDGGTAPHVGQVTLHRDGSALDAALFDRADLRAGDVLSGPALVIEANATTIIEPGWTARITGLGDMIIQRTAAAGQGAAQPEPAFIELFNNLFMHIAEQGGTVLQNTARSVNIRERLDFSCAIFDAEGRLVANAPHVPVHLGAMGESVRSVLRRRAHSLRPGDVVALNNPFDGGTHLPDVTIITPLFDPDGERLLFFAGARGHHVDIGGTTPGSTPAFSRCLHEEGVVIDDFLLVSEGHLREAEFRALLASGPHPARDPDTNLADIRAQIAANARIVAELHRALAAHGAPTLARATRLVMGNAEASVRRTLTRLSDGDFTAAMDDGGKLCVAVRKHPDGATIDFTGTSPQRADNFNAPPAVLRAVVLYVFRCLAGDDIPLNDGCLAPLRIVIPPGTFLSPAPGAAVVAGNTEISQTACNALFAALGVMAASQGTMNNLLFGDQTRQYYETICGGTGAGPGFDGADAVHSHMTNTRMTDPEVLELRYPVRIEEFAVRPGSGGDGAYRGGRGAIRRLRFLAPMQAVLVASSRGVPPFGLAGGLPGAAGRQWIERADGRIEPQAGVAQMQLATGDALIVETPGGGGFGVPRCS